MRATRINVRNFRSIRETGDIALDPLQALVGENNAGKSNLLRALHCFLTSGAGGMRIADFNDPASPAIIECEFGGLSAEERRKVRPYLLGDRIVLRKELRIEVDAKGKMSVKAEYHGYQAEPREQHLSIAKIEAANPGRANWAAIADAAGIRHHVQEADGRVTKASYKAGIERYLLEHEVEYDEAVLGETHALGIPQNLLAALPEIFLLPAITDYSDEVDKRSTTTVFRRLMGELSDRIIQVDPRYQELEAALATIRALLNPSAELGEAPPARLEALSNVETQLCDVVKKLMPSVQSININVDIETSRDIFSRGVTIRVDDGVLTDVLDKGNGMQRSLIFSLLQMLIAMSKVDGAVRPIILAIEEPELYIHPHTQRLIFRVLKEFAGVSADGDEARGSDQVVYTTHSPAFVEVWNYQRIGVVRKPDLHTGTIVRQAAAGVLDAPTERKTFKLLTCFGLKHNEVFFSKDAVLVEGPNDEVGVIAAARKLGRIHDLMDEIGVSILAAGSKGEIPKFQKVLNAFGFDYGVLLEMDGRDDADESNAVILGLAAGKRVARMPEKLETIVGLDRHFDDQRHAQEFFSDNDRITPAFEAVVQALLPPL